MLRQETDGDLNYAPGFIHQKKKDILSSLVCKHAISAGLDFPGSDTPLRSALSSQTPVVKVRTPAH